MATLDDKKVAAFNLRHDSSEDGVNERVEGGVADQIVGDVNKEALVR